MKQCRAAAVLYVRQNCQAVSLLRQKSQWDQTKHQLLTFGLYHFTYSPQTIAGLQILLPLGLFPKDCLWAMLCMYLSPSVSLLHMPPDCYKMHAPEAGYSISLLAEPTLQNKNTGSVKCLDLSLYVYPAAYHTRNLLQINSCPISIDICREGLVGVCAEEWEIVIW